MKFVHLHVHSEFSILDGCGKQQAFIEKAVRLHQPAIGFSEHGTLRGIYRLHENAEKLGIKPIFGVELYVCNDRRSRGLSEDEENRIRISVSGRKAINEALFQREKELGLRDRFHLTVFAKNNEGLRNLIRLVSVGWLEGYWKRPRVDFETLDRYGDGLIVLSGCIAGVIPSLILRGDLDGALKQLAWMRGRWKEDFFLEIMPTSLPEQVKVNKAIKLLSKRFGIPMVATTDCHYVERDHARTHEVLLCVRTHDTLNNPDRFRFTTSEFWMQTPREIMRKFAEFHPSLTEVEVREAMRATVMIAEKCNAQLTSDRFAALIPSPGLPEQFGSEFEHLSHLCSLGWHERDMPGRIREIARRRGLEVGDLIARYSRRLMHELKEIKRLNVVRYFLVVWDLYQFARSAEIVCGPGRGSAGGCLVSYLLRITEVDPVEHGLLFERFLNPDRTDLPDVDCDFEDARRDELIRYLREKYGLDRTAHITTVSKMAGKAAVRDLGRALSIPISEVDAVASTIIDLPGKTENVVERALTGTKTGRDFASRYPEVLTHAKVLEGHARGLGIHAAGIVVSPVPLIDVVPLETRIKAKAETIVTGLEMDGCQARGLLKIDVLGLRNLTAIKLTLAAIEERTGKRVDLDSIRLDDATVLQKFTDQEFVGIFQFDTPSARSMSRGVKFESFEDIVALNALNRPGTARSGLAAEWLARKAKPEAIKSIHPVIDRACSDSLGVIVYQEHVIKILVEFAGFPPGEADTLRKKISKSKGIEAIASEREKFIKGAKRKGNDPKLAEKLIRQISAFGRYGFNKSHATAYALIAFREMWLKTHFPAEFIFGLLSTENGEDEVRRFLKESRRLGVEVHPPRINESASSFRMLSDGSILGGFDSIKGVGGIASEAIVRARGQEPFGSFKGLLMRIDRRKVNRRVIEVLVRSGAMDALIPNRRWFLENIEEVWKLLNRKDWKRELSLRINSSMNEPDYPKTIASEKAAEVCPLAIEGNPLDPYRKLLTELMEVPWLAMDAEDFFENTSGFVFGIVTNVHLKRVGDFSSGEETEEEKERKGWGRMFAVLQIEDFGETPRRIKVDWDTFERFKPIIDRGTGFPIAAHVGISKGSTWESLRVHFLVDVKEIRQKLREKTMLDRFQRAFFSKLHPVREFSAKNISKLAQGAKRKVRLIGMVTHLAVRKDRKMEEMGFFGLLGFRGYVDVVCFSSSWGAMVGKFNVGDIVRMDLVKSESGLSLDGDSEVSILSRRDRV